MFGLYIVLARRWGQRYALDGTLVTIANLATRGPLLLAIEWLRAPGTLIPASPDPAAVVALLTIAFGASSTANLLLMASVRRVPAGRTSAALLLTPVSSAIIAALVLGERLTPVELFGAALILAGIAGAAGVFDRLAGTQARQPGGVLSPDSGAGRALGAPAAHLGVEVERHHRAVVLVARPTPRAGRAT